VVFVVHRDRLENRFRALNWLQEPDYCPLMRNNPGFIGLPTGHNTLRSYLYVMGVTSNPTCRTYGTEGETSIHILCECEALASLRHAEQGFFFFEPEYIRKLSTGAIWNFGKGTELL
jgi:hypothetical protein